MDGRGRFPGRKMVAPVLLLAMFLLLGCGAPEDPGVPRAETTTTSGPVLPIKNEACLSCHQDFEARTKDEDVKVFSHKLHLAQRLACQRCHQPIGHTGSPLPDEKVCEECHGIEMPHPQDYVKAHGRQVDEQGDQICARCHNVYLHCQTCHGVQMPHPDAWTEKHGDIAWPQMQICSTCHEKSFCLTCHPVEMPHPGDWTRTHGLAVQEKSSQVCTACHQPELCTSCHGMPMPHPDNWGTAHPDVAKEKRAECLLCHDEADCASCHEIHQTHGKGGA